MQPSYQLSPHKNPAYIVKAKGGEDFYEAIIDTKVARVMKILKNGKSVYEWPGIIVVGHRGNVKFAPENTIPAFEVAIKYGADLVEMDIRETKDGQLVVIHDETVDRTTNGSGKISDLTLAQIKQLDAGSWFDPKFKGVEIPTLRETLRAIRGRAQPDIDFKAGTPSKLVEILHEEGFSEDVTIYSSDWDLIREVSKLSHGFEARPTVPNSYLGLPIIIDELDPPIINIDWEQFSERLVREVHLAGKKSFVNTMQNDTEFVMSKVIETAPNYIQTDKIDILIPILLDKAASD